MKKKICPFSFIFFLPSLLFSQLLLNSDLSCDYNVQPGDRLKGQLLLKNAGSDSMIVDIYQTDYSFNASGKNYYNDPGNFERSNTGWIDFGPKQITLVGGQNGIINYEIHVPNDSGLTGSYWSMIMIEESNVSNVKTKGFIQIQFKQRYGVQICTTFGKREDNKAEVTFSNPVLNTSQQEKVFSVDIENTGDLFIKPVVWLEIFSLEGKSLEVIHAPAERLYPDTSRRFKFQLSHFEPGTYKGILVADCGEDDIFGANYTIKLNK